MTRHLPLRSIRAAVRPLRFLTYLAPSIPRAFFEQTVDAVAARLGIDATLDCENEVSGPSPDTDPFVSGRADFAFVCAPSYPLLAQTAGATLVGAAPVPADPRAEGRARRIESTRGGPPHARPFRFPIPDSRLRASAPTTYDLQGTRRRRVTRRRSIIKNS